MDATSEQWKASPPTEKSDVRREANVSRAFSRAAAGGVAWSLSALLLVACSEDSRRVRFADEGDRCRDATVVYIADDGDELFCERFDYEGPLTPGQKDEVLSLASELASDGSLSEKDRDRIRALAADPPDLVRRPVDPVSGLAMGDGRLWVRDDDAVVAVDPATEATEILYNAAIPSEFAVEGGALWFLNDPGVVGHGPERGVLRVDFREGGASELVPLVDDRVGRSQGIASGAESVWSVWERIAGGSMEEGEDDRTLMAFEVDVSSARVVRRVPLSVRADSVQYPAAHVIVSQDAVWVSTVGEFGDERRPPSVVRIDPRSGDVLVAMEAASPGELSEDEARFPAAGGSGELAAGEGAVWVVGGGQVIRLDPETGQVVAIIEDVEGESPAVAGGWVWLLTRTAPCPPSTTTTESDVPEEPQPLPSSQRCPGLVRIDPKTNRVADLLPLVEDLRGGIGAGMVAAEDALWVAAFGKVLQINPSTGEVVGEIALTKEVNIGSTSS